MTAISEDDLVASVADAPQYIAVYRPPTFVKALAEAHAAERSPAARDAIRQILVNSRMAAFGRRPICQDTGVNAFADLGMEAIHEFVVEDMPVTVAVDAEGTSVHRTGPSLWRRPPVVRVSGLAEA